MKWHYRKKSNCHFEGVMVYGISNKGTFWRGQPVNILLWIYTFSVFRDSIVLEQLAIKPLTCCEKNIRFNGNLHQTSTAGGCFRILLIFVALDIFTVISEYFLHVHSNIIPLKTVWSSSFVISSSKKGIM